MKVVKCCAGASLLAASILRLSGQIDYTFTGAVSADWFNPANWAVGGIPSTQIPGNNDNVTIGPNLITAVISNSVQVHDLQIINQGALGGSGDLIVRGTFDFNSTAGLLNPTISGSGKLYVYGAMNVRGSCSLNRSLYNYGTVALLQSGGAGPAMLLCSSNLLFDNYGVIMLEDTTALDGGASLVNIGSIQKPTGTNAAYLGMSSSVPGPNVNTLLSGIISVGSGTLSLYASALSSSAGEYHTESNGVLFLHFLHNLGGRITGAGVCILDGTANIPSLLPLNVAGTLQLNPGGTMQSVSNSLSPGLISNGGTLILQGGTVSNVNIASTGTIQLGGFFDTTLTQAFITNSGTASWRGIGDVLDGESSSSIFLNRGQFTDLADHTFAVAFYNSGSFVKTLADTNNPSGLGSGVTSFVDLEDLAGSIDVASGTVSIENGSLSSSTISVEGAALECVSGAITAYGRTLVTTGPTNEFRIKPLQVFTIASNATVQVSGNLRFLGNIMAGAGTLYVSSGTFFFDGGTLSVSNILTAPEVTITNSVQSAGQGFLNCTLTNQGYFVMAGSVDMTGSMLTNAPSGLFLVSQDLDLTGPGSTIQNGGLMQVTNGATLHLAPQVQNYSQMRLGGPVYADAMTNYGEIIVDGSVVASGPVTQQSGSLSVGPSGSLGAPNLFLNGGKLFGQGSIIGRLINNGLGVDPPQVNGDYTSTSNGTVTIHLGGLAPITEYDQFNISGNAALNGTLNLSPINGFVPARGNSFTVMTFGARTGTFAVNNGLKLTNGLYLMPIYSSTNLTLVATNVTFIQPAIQVSPGPAAGSIQLTWPGIPGQSYQVQFSADLIHWFVLTNLTGTGSTLTFYDSDAFPAPPTRFYRLR
ncbi:exported hypothetical protein [Verrucomicrobia bacterium]|nr:exported hypothetical protein [Verrucomicrobiota bacterium]